jgi:hypothetical protein
VRADESFPSAAVAADRPTRGVRVRSYLGTAAFWLIGSAVVVLAQPGSDRKLAAAGAAAAGIATIVGVSRLTPDPDRRYFRSILGAMVAVSVVGDWLVQHLTGNANGFVVYGLDTRIALPLIFVLLAPLALRALPVRLRSRALWSERSLIVREARPLDWVALGYALLIVPDLLLGLAHHASKTYIAQDLGLVVFFVFAYVLGRTISVPAARDSALELVAVLLLLGCAQALFGWDTTPIFTYIEAACAGAVAFALFKPTKVRVLLLALAVALLVRDLVQIKNGTGSTTGVELVAALGVIAYLVVRERRLVPQWLLIGGGVLAAAVFLAFTADGATVRGQYRGADQSNLGRAYEAHQVQQAIRSSPVSFVFGRGLGGSIDETKAPPTFAQSLVYGGRDLAHVQEVHLLPYEFLLKYGLLGFALLAALLAGVVILGLRALETASGDRDPTLVIYAALPLLGVAAALAAATHLQDNPLNALALGVLVTRLDRRAVPAPALRLAVPAIALVAAVFGAIAFTRPLGSFFYQSPNPFPLSARVGAVRVSYPTNFRRRYFESSKPAITLARGTRVHGVVIASYPLKRAPELGGSGQRFRPDGVFLELYKAPGRGANLAPVKPFPLTIFDLPDIAGLPGAREQGGTTFSAKGRNYRVILWVGPKAPKEAQLAAEQIVTTIRVR